MASHPVELLMLTLELILCMIVATGLLGALIAVPSPGERQRQ
jgi:hypothetical protein